MQDRDLARVFSHKPTIVSTADGGKIKHNGTLPGFLYRIAEEVGPDDVYPHPRSSAEYGKEWVTRRQLRLTLIGPERVREEETLTEDEIAGLRKTVG